MHGSRLILTCILAAAAAAARQNVPEALRSIRADQLRAHAAFLADDLLEGRAPGTRGGRIAARYIATQFRRAGLHPVGSSFVQRVPINGWTAQSDDVSIEIDVNGRRVPLRYPDDVVVWSASPGVDTDPGGDIVFVGYGAIAPRYHWDDYKDADLSGKIALILVNDPPAPPGEPDLFDGPAMTYFGRWTYKVAEAARRGAAGALIIHTPEGAGYPWSVVESSWTGEHFSLPRDSSDAPPLGLEGWIRRDAIARVLRTAGLDLDQLVARAGRRDFRAVDTGLKLRAHIPAHTRSFDSANVIGLVQGRDTTSNESVIFTAHYDHLGMGKPVNGDSIYNGAYDNASGVAVLLELAEAFARLHPAPARSILFIATTAEEAGLLGAQYYVRHPVLPLAGSAAVINFDGANVWGETDDVVPLGAERSTLGAIVQKRATELGLRIAPEPAPEQGFFFRSDQFPFARAGIPAIKFEHGLNFRGRPAGWGTATLAHYHADRYHRPDDEMDPDFDFAGAVQQARLAFLVGYDVAQDSVRPQWIGNRERPVRTGTHAHGTGGEL